MFVLCLALMGADIGSPIPLEQRVATLEAFRRTQTAWNDEAYARLATIEARLATVIPPGPPVYPQTAKADPPEPDPAPKRCRNFECACIGCTCPEPCTCIRPEAAKATWPSDHIPTYHYPPNTTYRIEGGQVITSAQPAYATWADGRVMKCDPVTGACTPFTQAGASTQAPVTYRYAPAYAPMVFRGNCGPRG